MTESKTLRESHPLRTLLIAALVLVVLAQAAAMVMVTRMQVQKAQDFYAAQQQKERARDRLPAPVPPAAGRDAQLAQVSYQPAR